MSTLTIDSRLDQAVPAPHGRSVEPGHTLPASHPSTADHRGLAGGAPTTDSSQGIDDSQTGSAAVGSSLPGDQPILVAHRGTVAGDQTEDGSAATIGSATPTAVPSLADPFLALAADVLDDLETVRIANENRLRQLTRTATDSDGEERGFGLDESHPDVARLAALVDMLAKAEHQATLNLARALRQHPLGPWVKAQKGVGEKQAARLLAVIGDPYVNVQTGEARTVSQLGAYCGHGDPARKRAKGMTQAELFRLGNPVAKSRVWLIASAVLKAQGPLSAAYYNRKTKTEGRVHAAECRRCGPSGKPALTGSPWSDAHRHADALRVLGKEILRGLWIEAKRIHEEEQ